MPSTNGTSLLDTYLAHADELKRFLVARLGSQQDAEDVFQELYFRVQRVSDAADIRNGLSFIYRMAFNLARDHRRERTRSQRRDGDWIETSTHVVGTETVADIPPADIAYEGKQRLERVREALEELTPHCRRVFRLHKFEGLSHSEISARLGISRSTVEKHMTTALKHLLRKLDRG